MWNTLQNKNKTSQINLKRAQKTETTHLTKAEFKTIWYSSSKKLQDKCDVTSVSVMALCNSRLKVPNLKSVVETKHKNMRINLYFQFAKSVPL